MNKQLFKIFLRPAMFNIWYDYKNIQSQKGLNILHKDIWTKICYTEYILLHCSGILSMTPWSWFYYLMAIVVQVNDVALWPLVILISSAKAVLISRLCCISSLLSLLYIIWSFVLFSMISFIGKNFMYKYILVCQSAWM